MKITRLPRGNHVLPEVLSHTLGLDFEVGIEAFSCSTSIKESLIPHMAERTHLILFKFQALVTVVLYEKDKCS